jgi:hypothetical protein
VSELFPVNQVKAFPSPPPAQLRLNVKGATPGTLTVVERRHKKDASDMSMNPANAALRPVENRALTGTGRPGNRHELSLLDRQGNASEGVHPGVTQLVVFPDIY